MGPHFVPFSGFPTPEPGAHQTAVCGTRKGKKAASVEGKKPFHIVTVTRWISLFLLSDRVCVGVCVAAETCLIQNVCVCVHVMPK